MAISDEQKRAITQALQQRGAILPCPRCANNSFILMDGYINQSVQTDLQGLVIGGPSMPTVAVICTRCGYVSQHNLIVLGLMPPNPASADSADGASLQKTNEPAEEQQ